MKLAFISLSYLLGVAYSQTVYYNVREISMPRFRFEFWNALSLGLRNDALSIGYNQETWQTMATNQIEEYSYFIFQDTDNLDDKDLEKVVKNLDVSNVTAVLAEMGFDEDTYDCWMNHYIWYDWDELVEFDFDDAWVKLGWDASNWESENENDLPDSEEKDWDELTPNEKQAAADLCFLPETWDGMSFSTFLDTSDYFEATEPWLKEDAAPPGFGAFQACFSAHTLVEREDGTVTPMKDLSLGDRVLVSNGKYEPIYTFGHFDTSVVNTEFLRINTRTSSGLELTPNHLIFTEGNQPVPASSIKIGGKVMMANGETDTVIRIQKVTRTGIFAPFTSSGTIVTNGVLSSSFATIQESRYVSLGGFEIPLTYHQLGVIFESPHRLLCHLLGSNGCAVYEDYNEEGMSQWVEKPMVVFQWVLKQNVIAGGILFLTSLTLLCMINLMELLVVNPASTIALVAAFVAHRRHRVKQMM